MGEKVPQRGSSCHFPADLQGQQTGGGRAQHSTVYRRRSHLPPGTPKGRKGGPARPQNSAPGLSRGPISRLGRPSFQGHSRAAGPRGQGEVGGKLHTRGLQARSVLSGSRTICISPRSSRTVAWIPERRLCGGALASPARSCERRRARDHPATVSAQLANSGTFAKLPRAGEPRRSGPHHRGPGGGSGPRAGPAARRSTGKSRERAGARGARQPTRRRAARGARLGGARGRRGRQQSPHTPVAAVRWPSPAPRLASGGSAAELERGRRRGRFSSPSCCRRRADGRTRGAGGGAARPAGRGGADRPR